MLRSSSAAAFIDGELRDHPLWIESRAALAPHDGLRRCACGRLAILEAADKDPSLAGGLLALSVHKTALRRYPRA